MSTCSVEKRKYKTFHRLGRKKYRPIGMALVVLLTLSVFPSCWRHSQTFAANTTVVIDGTHEYQTIEGLGGHMETHPPGFSPEFWDLLFNDIGATGIIITGPPDYKADPWEPLEILPMLKEAKAHGVKLYFCTFSSPKAEWKSSKSLYGGTLLPEYYKDFSNYIVDYINHIRTETGVDITHVNPIPEPSIEHAGKYPSCGISAKEYANFLKVFGPMLRRANNRVKIVAPACWNLTITISYVKTMLADEAARGYLDVVGSSIYGWPANNHTWNVSNPKQWQTLADIAHRYQKETFSDEASHVAAHMPMPHPAGIHTAKWIHHAFVDGDAVAFMWFLMLHKRKYNPALQGFVFSKDWPPGEFTSDGITKYGYAFKQFAHWVRPGAVRVESTSHDVHLLVSAYKHLTYKTFTIVAINDDTRKNKNVLFKMNKINQLSSLDVYRTSKGENSANLQPVTVAGDSFAYDLPKESITTFFGHFATP